MQKNDRMCGVCLRLSSTKTSSLCFKQQKKEKVELMDGDPSENSARAGGAMRRVGCELFKIPARSPQLNGCENVFNIAASKLRKDALQRAITLESYEQFCNRV